jgi:hypothetical protein
MSLTEDQLKRYENDGYLLLPQYFSTAEVEVMRAELPIVFARDTLEKVMESNGGIVRSVYGSHTRNDVFRRLSKHPRIIEPAVAILNSEVYVYQFKINLKSSFGGDIWEWHQDYVYWLKEDGMPSARVLNAIVFLDDVTEFNGPIFLLPGSHHEGVIETPIYDPSKLLQETQPQAYHNSPSWIYNLTAKLKYALDKETVGGLVHKYGLVAPKGPRGTVLLTNPNLVHGSANNISPFDRVIAIITYNSIENIPAASENPRPEFIASRNSEAIVPLADNALFLSGG